MFVGCVHSLLMRDTLSQEAQGWYDAAAFHARNEDYYRGLLDACAEHLGPAVFLCDDGSVSESPLRTKVPELVAALAERAR
jgi:hypothetical protein